MDLVLYKKLLFEPYYRTALVFASSFCGMPAGVVFVCQGNEDMADPGGRWNSI